MATTIVVKNGTDGSDDGEKELKRMSLQKDILENEDTNYVLGLVDALNNAYGGPNYDPNKVVAQFIYENNVDELIELYGDIKEFKTRLELEGALDVRDLNFETVNQYFGNLYQGISIEKSVQSPDGQKKEKKEIAMSDKKKYTIAAILSSDNVSTQIADRLGPENYDGTSDPNQIIADVIKDNAGQESNIQVYEDSTASLDDLKEFLSQNDVSEDVLDQISVDGINSAIGLDYTPKRKSQPGKSGFEDLGELKRVSSQEADLRTILIDARTGDATSKEDIAIFLDNSDEKLKGLREDELSTLLSSQKAFNSAVSHLRSQRWLSRGMLAVVIAAEFGLQYLHNIEEYIDPITKQLADGFNITPVFLVSLVAVAGSFLGKEGVKRFSAGYGIKNLNPLSKVLGVGMVAMGLTIAAFFGAALMDEDAVAQMINGLMELFGSDANPGDLVGIQTDEGLSVLDDPFATLPDEGAEIDPDSQGALVGGLSASLDELGKGLSFIALMGIGTISWLRSDYITSKLNGEYVTVDDAVKHRRKVEKILDKEGITEDFIQRAVKDFSVLSVPERDQLGLTPMKNAVISVSRKVAASDARTEMLEVFSKNCDDASVIKQFRTNLNEAYKEHVAEIGKGDDENNIMTKNQVTRADVDGYLESEIGIAYYDKKKRGPRITITNG